MGFDNDCILNIQSLAGEYFCPVCRLLVYPNEALQSQCTHLYCKPCLTYVVSTTRACPYDGYLVTEADSKPLTVSNPALVETIGNIAVHCLFHRSGCTWQGPLSECTAHCSECAFGNSLVVCNRCSVQILHRQVQEHAQNCPGVKAPVQQVEAAQENTSTATAAASTDKTQASTQAGTATSQSQPSQSTSMPVQDPSQQPNSNIQGQVAVQTSLPTHEQWYQLQQYYQQYPGYDPYQQHYQQNYPYQQQAFGQYQQNFQAHTAQVGQQQPSQPYLQAQPQAHPLPQGPAQQQLQPQAQPQNQGPAQQQLQTQVQPQTQSNLPVQSQMASQIQVQVNQQQPPQPAFQSHSQLLPQVHPNSITQTQSYPQGQPHSAQPPGQHPQMPQYQQPYPQMQISQSAVHSLSQQHHLHPQAQPHPQALPQPHTNMQPQAQHQSSHAVTNNQSYPQVQLQSQSHQQMQLAASHQQPMQVHAQGPQQLQYPQPSQMHPPVQSQIPIYQQHQAPVPSHGQVSVAMPTQMQQSQAHAQHAGHPIQQRPIMRPVVQPTPLVHNQSYGGQLVGHQQQLSQPLQSPLRPQGPPHAFQQTQSNSHSQQIASSFSHGVRHHQSQGSGARPVVPTHLQSQPYMQSAGVLQARQLQSGTNRTSANDETEPNVLDAGAGIEHDNLKTMKSKTDIQSISDESKPIGLADNKCANMSTKDIPQPELHPDENGNPLKKHVVKEEALGSSLKQDGQKLDEVVTDSQKKFAESGDDKNKFQGDEQQNGSQSQMPGHFQMQAKGAAQSAHPVLGADRGFHQPSNHREALTLQQRPHNQIQGEVNPPHGQSHGISYIDNRRPDLQHSVSSGQGLFGQPSDIHISLSRRNELAASKTQFDPMNPLNMDPGQRRFDDDLKKFPRPSHLYSEHVSEMRSHFPSSGPFDGVPHGFGDTARRPLKHQHLGHSNDRRHSPGAALHPYHLGPREAGEHPFGLIDDPTGRLISSHTHPDFHGPIPSHGLRHMDGRLTRNSSGEYLGNSHGFGGLPGDPGRYFGLEDVKIRESRQFSGPLGNSFHVGRFPLLPSQSRRSEFEGLGDFRIDGRFRDDASFRDFPGNPRFRSFPDHPPPHDELFGGNMPNHPKPGEPGFRSSFILQGDLDPFDNSRKRKHIISMGWCRICKVDCETVDGLDIHSQTREHQKLAMDMVRSIKQNAKKHKLTSSDHSSLEDANRSKSAKSEGRKSNN